jgi:hypothetical protein
MPSVADAAPRQFAIAEQAQRAELVSRPRHPFDSPARAALSCTVVAGALIAVAPMLPAAVRLPALFAALVGWTAALVGATISAAQLAARSRARDYATATTALAIIGIVVTAVAITQLQIIRLVDDRPALTWNIDWRFHLNHAQAIARFGGIDRALDYAGVGVDYHPGPAWLAGATERVLGWGLYGVSFGLVPLLGFLAVVTASLQILRIHGIPYRVAAAATAIAMTLPGLRYTPLGVYYLARGDVSELSDLWTFSAGLMHNVNFGLAVGMASLALLLDRRSRGWHLALASLGLASLVKLKPQFFVGLGLLVGIIVLERLVSRTLSKPRPGRVLAAAVAALVLGLTFTAAPPSSVYQSVFAHPVWAPGRTGYSLHEFFSNATLLFLLTIVVWFWVGVPAWHRKLVGIATATYIGFAAVGGVQAPGVLLLLAIALWSLIILRTRPACASTACYELLMGVAAGMAILVLALCLVSVPIRAEVVAQARHVVESAFSATSEQENLGQAVTPLRLLLVTSALGLLALRAAQSSTGWRRTFCAAGALSVTSLLALVGYYFVHPLRGYEAAEDVGLYETLRAVPRDARLLAASDLADPAENYRRPLRAFLLPGYMGHAFFVANLRYLHYARPDAAQRLVELRAFFGSAWSPWHEGWLRRRGIGYVLISDRCLPVWFNQASVPLRPLAHHGHWTAYEMRSGKTAGPPAPIPSTTDLTPRYGAQGCLSFREAAPI